MPEHISTGTPDEATNDLVAQITARVVAAMREQKGDGAGAAPSSAPSQPFPPVSEVADKARQGAAGVVGAAKEQAVSRLDKQKEHAVEELASVAETVRQMGQQLKSAPHGAVVQYAAHYGDSAADHLEQASGYLRDHDVKQLVSEVEGFARREPWLFGGGALLLGLLGARFLKSKPVAEAAPIAEETPAARPAPETVAAPGASVPTTIEAVPDLSVAMPGDDAVFDNELAGREQEEMDGDVVATPSMTGV